VSLANVTGTSIQRALEEFDRIGRDAMFAKYGGRPTTTWYIEHDRKDYDHRLVIRAAHSLQGLGPLPAKRGGPGNFTAGQARKHLGSLGFKVIRWTRHEDLPRFVFDEIKENIRNYTVGFYCAEKGVYPTLLGSGVLVSVGNTRAILTACHVIEVMKEPREKRTLGLLFADRSESHAVDPSAIGLLKIARGTKNPDGPDLGAVVLAPHTSILSSMKANKVFFNLDKRRERMLQSPPRLRDGIWAAQGFVSQLTNVKPAEGEGPAQVKMQAVTAFGCNDAVIRRGGYDYLDYFADPADSRPTPTPPNSWGGMSGGGLWQILLNQGGDQVGHERPLLSGIMFYELPTGGRIQHIRCHGPKSLYEQVFKTIERFRF